MKSRIKYLLVLLFTLVTSAPTIFAAERAPEDRYQHVFFVPECPICFEALTADDTVQTTCRHLFHRRCLDEALRRNNVCPSCRHDFAHPVAAHPVVAVPAHHAAAVLPVAPAVAVDLAPHPINQEFVDAALRGNEARVIELLAAGIDVNSVGPNGQTALMQAAQQGHIDIVQDLLAAGADVNIVQIPPARIAAAMRFRVGLNTGPTALSCAASGSGPTVTQLAIVRLLIAAGANVNHVAEDHNYRNSILMSAIYIRVANETIAPIVQELLAAGAGATINVVNQQGQTVLSMAAEQGDTAAVQALLAAGAIVDLAGPWRCLPPYRKGSALIVSVERGHEAVVRLLIGAGANVNIFGPTGKTVLEITQQNRNQSMGNQVEYNKWSNIERLLRQAGAI
ncbi:MAG: ankyrin repeat domain-containing protein [Candidatus Babeliales bacterium]|jgi:ankyrin repeat protein